MEKMIGKGCDHCQPKCHEWLRFSSVMREKRPVIGLSA